MGVECNEHRNMIIIQGESISVQNVVASIQIYMSSVRFVSSSTSHLKSAEIINRHVRV